MAEHTTLANILFILYLPLVPLTCTLHLVQDILTSHYACTLITEKKRRKNDNINKNWKGFNFLRPFS